MPRGVNEKALEESDQLHAELAKVELRDVIFVTHTL